ncbi:MAG: hypothetical protein ACFE0R_06965 [Salinarimonas sp.]
MRTLSRLPGRLRTTIAVVALYALVLAGLLGGLSGALSLSAAAVAAPGGTVWCPVDGSMPANAPGDHPCWHTCRLGAGSSGPALAPLSTIAPPARLALPLARVSPRSDAPRARVASAPLGARAPPLS